MENTVLNPSLEALADELESAASAVEASSPEARTMQAVHGWTHPALNKYELSAFASRLAETIRADPIAELDEELAEEIDDATKSLAAFTVTTIRQGYLCNGNGAQAIPAYFITLAGIERLVAPLYGWSKVSDPSVMPRRIKTRLASLKAEIGTIAPDIDKLAAQVKDIAEAHAAAESLPTDLEALHEARSTIADSLKEATAKVADILKAAEAAEKALGVISLKEVAATKLADKCDEAYRTTTTTGLAAAFTDRGKKVSWSMWVWVVILLLSLGLAMWIGADRYHALSAALTDPKLGAGAVALHLLVSALGVGAPFWLAWIATLQIGQRFRLAEDYAFKATVARAYEGYRREAVRLDQESAGENAFEQRLFGAALQRLEEEPLRYVSRHDGGSPLEAFFARSDVGKLLDESGTGLRMRLLEIFNKGPQSPQKVVEPIKPTAPPTA